MSTPRAIRANWAATRREDIVDEILSLGLWIKRRRKALDLTQDDLARLVGCSKELITKIEGDARRPSR
jgi:predicted transcriptional regulator